MKKITIKAEERKVTGRKVRKLRREGLLPANVYGKKIKSQSVQIPLDEFRKVWQEAGESGLVEVTIGEKEYPALIHHVQVHPVTGEPLHADFHHVSLTEKTTAKIPVELIGEAPAVEQKTGVLIQPLSEIEVEALPADLPEKLTVDISGLVEIDNQVTVADIKVDKDKVKILADPGELLAKIGPLQKEEVVAPPPAEEAVPVEGEAPAGEAVPAAETEKGQSEEKPAPAETTADKPKEEKK